MGLPAPGRVTRIVTIMDLERFVTAQDSGGTFRHGDRAATLSCERRLRRRVQSAMCEQLEIRAP
jgi:hypothetical protein